MAKVPFIFARVLSHSDMRLAQRHQYPLGPGSADVGAALLRQSRTGASLGDFVSWGVRTVGGC